MKLNEAIQDNLPLAVVTVDGGRRYMATSFIVPGGVVYFDTGWSSSIMGAQNPIHMIEGRVQGEGPWTVGDNTIEIMVDGDELADEHNEWLQYKQGPEGKMNSTRTKAWKQVRATFDIEEDLT